MKYITLDTCVWLGLIKEGLNSENNIFDEVCFWIEGKHLIHIVPENLIREWDRNKASKRSQIISDSTRLNNDNLLIRSNPDLASVYNPDRISELIDERLDRVDKILKNYSEQAKENKDIIDEAVKRNIMRLAPNHSKDSFRDSLNILTLINHIVMNKYTNCIFTTINYKDFSESKLKRFDLHPELTEIFVNANLEYVYCEEEDKFGDRLIDNVLRKKLLLPSFTEYLKERTRRAQEKKLEEKRIISAQTENLDSDYLENIRYIDIILGKKTPTKFEQRIISELIDSHDSYRQYFLKNVGSNGVV